MNRAPVFETVRALVRDVGARDAINVLLGVVVVVYRPFPAPCDTKRDGSVKEASMNNYYGGGRAKTEPGGVREPRRYRE